MENEATTAVEPDVIEVGTDPASTKLTVASRDLLAQIFLKDDRPSCYVNCPEWGLRIKMIAMLGNEAEAFQKKREKDKGTGMYDIIAACAVDEQGNRLFQDPGILKGRSLSVLNRLQNAALKLNGFKEEAVEDAKNG